jgi:hypothetical protein
MRKPSARRSTGFEWTTEDMDAVDRLLRELPHAAPPRPPPLRRRTRPSGQRAHLSRDRNSYPGGIGSTWARVLLGVVLAVSLMEWPYSADCGRPMVGFLAAAGMLAVCAVWTSAVSWKRRHALPHVVSIGLLIWALGLAGDRVLPRTGYDLRAVVWVCGSHPGP